MKIWSQKRRAWLPFWSMQIMGTRDQCQVGSISRNSLLSTFQPMKFPAFNKSAPFRPNCHRSHSTTLIPVKWKEWKRDIFYSGRIPDLDKRHKSSNHVLQSDNVVHSSDNTHAIQLESADLDKSRDKGCLQVAMSMLSAHILKHPVFMVICVANSLVQGGFVLCVYFTVVFSSELIYKLPFT